MSLPTASVPMDLLNSLLATVEQLKQDVSQLKTENVSMANELELLRQHNGSRFYLFSSLPTEIRNMIWKYALMSPQVQFFSNTRSSYSQVNRIMQACKESQTIGLQLRLPFYRQRRDFNQSYEELCSDPLTPSYFINFDVDTIWLDKQDHIPPFLHYYNGMSFEPRDIVWHHDGFSCPSTMRLQTLAIDLKSWVDPDLDSDPDFSGRDRDLGTINTLHALNGPRELLIVVARPSVFCPSKITFIEPLVGLHEMDAMQSIRSDLAGIECHSWDLAAERLQRMFVQLKEMRAEERRKATEDNTLTFKEYNIEISDLSDWEIPKVRYVEAVEVDSQWTQPAYCPPSFR